MLLVTAAMAIIPAMGIGEVYGGAVGWFSFFVLAGLFSIASELRQTRERIEKRTSIEAERAKLLESYASSIGRYQVDIVLALKEMNENVDFIKEKIYGRR